MPFKIFFLLKVFMTMRHICSWKHQFTSEKIMSIGETPYEICFHCDKISHWAKKLFLPLTTDNVLCRLDMQDTQEKDC